MERLNDIFGRTAHRRQPERDEQSMPSSQVQRAKPTTPSPRRPLPEQTARLGQYAQHMPSSQPSQGRMPAQQPHLPPYARGDYSGAMSQQRPASAVPPSPAPGRAMGGRPTPAPEHVSWSRQRPVPAYAADTYHPIVEADVEQAWEDDTATLQYGDWESDQYEEPARVQEPERLLPPPVSRGASRIAQSYPQNQRSLVTRELRRPGDGEDDMAIEPQASAPRLPAQSHRVTQPLAPSSPLSSLNRLPVQPRDEFPPRRPGQQRAPTAQSAPSIPAPYTSPKAPCPVCKGTGYLRADVPYGHPNFGKPIACECKEQERRERRRLQLQEISNLGELRDKGFDNFNPNVSRNVYEAYSAAREYAEEPDGWLIFIGRVGCGKTHLAAAIANRALARGSRVLFSTVSDLLDHLRATFTPSSTEVYDHLFQEMREAELLVLDDLGAQQSSPWANEKLFQLLNYRYNSQFPTIITTNNAGLQGIEERIRSRIMDVGLVRTVTFELAIDYRLRNPRRE